MKTTPKKLKVNVRNAASAGKFQTHLVPDEVLDENAIVQAWSAGAAINATMARTMLASLEGFIVESLQSGLQLNFNLVSFYPRLSGALSARNADPEKDSLHVRGAVKARRPLVNCVKGRLQAVNAVETDSPGIFNILDRDADRFDVVAAGHMLSAIGHDLVFDRSRDDEGVWLEARRKRQGIVRIAKARVTAMENDHVEFVFDDPIPAGSYFVSFYTRCGNGPGYDAMRACRQVKAI